jgi:hypothetical protein
MKIKVFSLIILVCIFSSCSSKLNDDVIRATGWKYGSGFYIGDFISFDHVWTLKKDTIYFKENPLAIVKDCYNRNDNQNVMEIISFDNNFRGTYFGKFNIKP